MLKFVTDAQTYPHKRAPDVRREDFNEIYQRYAPNSAADQSGRCSQCGVPYCQIHCPLSNNIPDWLMLTANGRLKEAWAVSTETNSFPEICGRICPQDRLCEGQCVIEQSGHGAVTIGSVEKYLTDTAWSEGWIKPIIPQEEQGQSVGIIGAGPGGLAAAERLRWRGYDVHIYDRYDRAGGLLIYGIPGFKLEKDVVLRRIKWLEDSGISFHLNIEIGTDITFQALRAKHDTILIATGVYLPRDIDVKGADLDNITEALPFLTASNRKGLGDSVPEFDQGQINAKGKEVVVIGGGDTAMDCVRTAIRQEARSVTCLYRRDRENMPGSQREVANAEEEGVKFAWLTTPAEFVGQNGAVDGVIVQHMRLGPPDKSGRRAPMPVEEKTQHMKADLVLKALGFEAEDLPNLFQQPDLPVTPWGTIKAAPITGATEMAGVFAAGDIVRGASLVVWAIRDARDAADAMAAYMRSKVAIGTAAE